MKIQTSLPSVGIIGYGSMGAALAEAFRNTQTFAKPASLYVYAKGRQPVPAVPEMVFTETLEELAGQSEIILVAVRPEQVAGVIPQLVNISAQSMQRRPQILLSVAAGIPLSALRDQAEKRFIVMRAMPNILVEAGKGIFGLCCGPEVSPDDKKRVLSILNPIGTVIEIDESLMNAFTALAGCGPGFLFHIMDSFCEAGVSVGLSREASRAIAVSLMGGCGLLAETTGRHPVILREQGTSPAGMTIAGLNYLDMTGVRGHLIEAVKIAQRQGRDMDQEISPS